jgi:hypothetical protein
MGLRGGRRSKISDKSLRKFARKCGSPEMLDDALTLCQLDYEAHPGASMGAFTKMRERYRELETPEQSVSDRQRVVSGKDIMDRLNIRQGPMVGTILDYAQDLYDDDPDIDKETMLVKIIEKFNPNED